MITPGYIRTMAAYNAEMNRRLYGAAARLSDDRAAGAAGRILGLDPRHPDPHPVGGSAMDVALRQLAETRHADQTERCR